MVRTVLGFGFGLILAFNSLGFAGAGHGTYAPMAFSGSVLTLITAFGALIPLLLTPLLWGAYFLFIPGIPKRPIRMWSAAVVLALHIVMGSWLALSDPAFARSLDTNGGQLFAFFVLLAVPMILLLYFAWRGTETRRP